MAKIHKAPSKKGKSSIISILALHQNEEIPCTGSDFLTAYTLL
jgi:hypothetical protein